MEFVKYKPALALRHCIDCFWTHEGELRPDEVYRCVPSGHVSIIIDTIGDKKWVKRGEVWDAIPAAVVAGIWTEPVVLKAAHRIRFFGIQFKLEAFVHLFRQPLCELENVVVDVGCVLGKEAGELAQQIACATDVAQRIALAEAYFYRKLNSGSPLEAYTDEAIRLIRLHGGQVSTEELSQKVFVSERQLQRAFRESFGITPKTYSRLVRFNKVSTYLQRNADNINWADLTYQCGYADQAHFIREFKEFTGSIPTAFAKNPVALSALSTGVEV